jgi:uncharacterized protein (DUF885 family)
MLTEHTTKVQYLTHLAEAYLGSARFGGNNAILMHMVKVQNMNSTDQWAAHRAKLLAAQANPARAATIGVLAQELAGHVAADFVNSGKEQVR